MSERVVLVTGGSGFIGRAVQGRLLRDGMMRVRGATRRSGASSSGVETVIVGELGPTTDWTEAVRGVDVVIHTAARVHVMRESAMDPLAEFRRVNVAGTIALGRQAAAAGVRRLVFISSIKVNGEHTVTGRPYRPEDIPAPVDPYGVSKREAEDGLRAIATETGMEVVIIRPVLVYGPGVKGNFRSMMRWLRKGIPLPLGAVHNQRSLVALDNLVDLISTCATHPSAANQVFLVSDGEDLSTTDLLRRTAAALGGSARLIPVPSTMLRAACRLLGRPDAAQRLCDSLQVDMSRTRDLLGWTPPQRVDDAFRQTAQHFLEQQAG